MTDRAGEERVPEPVASDTQAATDNALRSFLKAPDREADRRFDYLDREFLAPLIKATIARELRRGRPTTQAELFNENDTFHDLYLLVRGKIAQRLFALRSHLREQPVGEQLAGAGEEETIKNLPLYVITVARHGCVDYLRQKYPGRHSLDVSLRAVLETSSTLHLWRHYIDAGLHEWRCGLKPWQEEERFPISLRFNEPLKRQLRFELEGLERSQALQRLFEIVPGPLRYTEFVDFLAALWDVEAVYRMASFEQVSFRVTKPYLTGIQPEEAAAYYGALQNVWSRMQVLQPAQLATLLLKMPQGSAGSALEDIVRLGVATWNEIAERTELPVVLLQELSTSLPLGDEEIGHRIGLPTDEVRRVRQDARRKLQRQPREGDKESSD